MANADTEVDLTDLHQAIVADIRAQFPDLKLVEFYREEDDRDPPTPDQLPACLLEMSEMEPSPDDDPGTEQLAVNARFEARVIVGFRTPRAKLEVRRLAGALAVFLRLRRWKDTKKPGRTLPTGAAQVIGILPDEFDPELDRYEVWRVEWLQPLHLGKGVWRDEGLTPTTPLFSWSPDIGEGNAHKYRETIPPPPGMEGLE